MVLEVAEIALGGFCGQTCVEHVAQALTDVTLCPWSHVKVVHSSIVQPRDSPLPALPAAQSTTSTFTLTQPTRPE